MDEDEDEDFSDFFWQQGLQRIEPYQVKGPPLIAFKLPEPVYQAPETSWTAKIAKVLTTYYTGLNRVYLLSNGAITCTCETWNGSGECVHTRDMEEFIEAVGTVRSGGLNAEKYAKRVEKAPDVEPTGRAKRLIDLED